MNPAFQMKSIPLFCFLFQLLIPLWLHAQSGFNCGSNGSYGAMNITSGTILQVPPDGVFHCTTVNVANNVSLEFTRNALNTPVYILATGDVSISGIIRLSGRDSSTLAGAIGGPGGFDGGTGSRDPSVPAGSGGGPGGGAKGVWISSSQRTGGKGGSYKTLDNTGSGVIYGNHLLLPLMGGSGGGGGHGNSQGTVHGGGGGGGAILIASNTRISFPISASGRIHALGGSYQNPPDTNSIQAGSGSGGAIRLVAPIINGRVEFNVMGGGGAGGSGRIRIDTLDHSALNFVSGTPQFTQPDTIGSVMVVFPNPLPKLTIANAAGTAVAENASGPVSVILPAGTNPSQTIQVRARDFGSVVPIRVRLVPESGDATTYDATIDNTVNNPATTNVPVTLPINTGVRIEVFTR